MGLSIGETKITSADDILNAVVIAHQWDGHIPECKFKSFWQIGKHDIPIVYLEVVTFMMRPL